MEINKIYNEDCLITMQNMPDDFVDFVITSPPYDDIRNYNGYTFEFEKIAKELYRVMKQGGVVIWVVADATIDGSETGTSFKQALFFKEIGFRLHDTMIYYKNNPMPQTGKRYHQHFEYMFAFSKCSPKTFNPITNSTQTKQDFIRLTGYLRSLIKNGIILKEVLEDRTIRNYSSFVNNIQRIKENFDHKTNSFFQQHPYYLYQCYQTFSNYEKDFLITMYISLFDIDKDLKSTQKNPTDLLIDFFNAMFSPRK